MGSISEVQNISLNFRDVLKEDLYEPDADRLPSTRTGPTEAGGGSAAIDPTRLYSRAGCHTHVAF